jgi:hypothetical protein
MATNNVTKSTEINQARTASRMVDKHPVCAQLLDLCKPFPIKHETP